MVLFLKEPCGIFCVFLTYICVLYADYCMINHVVIPTLSNSFWGLSNVLIFNILILLLVVSHFQATTSDPGRVPLPCTSLDFSDMHQAASQVKDENKWTVCSRCETYRPPRAHHCRICRRCIRKMDHHCPWINNCVGERNQKYFVLFLIYTGLTSIHAIVLSSVSLSLPCIDCSEKYAFKTRQFFVISLILEGLLFGLFVMVILCDQFSSICNDTTAVEYVQKKGSQRNKASRNELLMEVFGKGPLYMWFLPCFAPEYSSKYDMDTSFIM
ncbi:palmitoyltransferase ZDHHC7-like [Xenia sp. Carnegie-2017]|uniref:palmitoyltransferase ZDHHC7-like n=1 Tax=Xenia sp. Carnegie-2017 TaxID=2897299 RepID=UPI001F03A551|nr:palmitoyltransferase ZDHHC7-like [Xenia sp. Carnegie-2017]